MQRWFLWGFVFLLSAGAIARASFIPPAGYAVQNLGIVADGFGVSSTGELATANVTGNTATITLYNTWQAGRTVIGTTTITTPSSAFVTDIAFTDNSTIYLGENSSTNTLYKVDFSQSSPAVTSFPSGSFHGIQGIVIKGNQMLISGTDSASFQAGNFYLEALNLGNNVITPVAGGPGTGSGFVGGTAFTPGGKGIVLDSAGKAYVYDLSDNSRTVVSLADALASGAYGIATDAQGNAYVTAGDEIEKLSNLDGAVKVTSFGNFDEGADGFPFPTGIAFTGGDFTPYDPDNNGALIVNGEFTSEGGLFAIVALPEPATFGLIGLGAAMLFARRRSRATIKKPFAGACGFAAILALLCSSSTTRADQFFASQVIDHVAGLQQSGEFSDPSLALGAPLGAGTAQGSTDVYNLGIGNADGARGTLTLGFNTATQQRVIRDQAGADFVVFENAFYAGGDETASFAELVFVDVSSDGVHFARFPTLSLTKDPLAATDTLDPGKVSGFAGVHPVIANANDSTSPSPFNTASIDDGGAGGDAFDLSSLSDDPLVKNGLVDLQNIRYVKLTDVLGNGTVVDSVGNPTYDPTGAGNDGADIDALAVLNGAIVPEPSAGAVVLSLSAISLLKRANVRQSQA